MYYKVLPADISFDYIFDNYAIPKIYFTLIIPYYRPVGKVLPVFSYSIE